MTLLNAPEFDERSEARKKNILVGSGISIVALVLLAVGGFVLGHGWLFMNWPVEHKVSVFLKTLQDGDYAKAYGLFYNDADWQQHPQKYVVDYPLKRFTEDFSTASDWKAPVTSYKVNCSKRDASGTAVNTTINGNTPLTLKYQRSDGTLSFFPYELTCGF
jgi:hypothetical protein